MTDEEHPDAVIPTKTLMEVFTEQIDTPGQHTDIQDFTETMEQILAMAGDIEPCMSLEVNQSANSVELFLDSSVDHVSEWIKGEGADIALMRCRETGKVIGVRLPLLNRRLVVHHTGPIRINSYFKKNDDE